MTDLSKMHNDNKCSIQHVMLTIKHDIYYSCVTHLTFNSASLTKALDR